MDLLINMRNSKQIIQALFPELPAHVIKVSAFSHEWGT